MSLTKATYSMIQGAVLNVLDYGADPSGTSDSASAFTAAIAAINDAGTIFVPTGFYLINTTILVNKRVAIIGTGNAEQVTSGYVAGTELRKASTLNGPLFEIAQGKVHLEAMWLKGIAGNGGAGVYVRAPNFSASRVTVSGMGDAGFTIGGTTSGINANTWRLDACVSIGNNYGFVFTDNDAVVDCNAGTATNIKAAGNTLDGVYVDKAEKNTFVGTLTEGNGRYGINLLAGSKYNVFVGGDQEQNTTADINVNSSASDSVLINPGIFGTITDASASTTHIAYGSNSTMPYAWSLEAVSQVQYSGSKPVVVTNAATAPAVSATGYSVYFPITNSKTVTVTPGSFAMLFLVQLGGGTSAIAYADWANPSIGFIGTPPATIAATNSPTSTQLGIYKTGSSYDIKFVSGSNLSAQGTMSITFIGASVSAVTDWV